MSKNRVRSIISLKFQVQQQKQKTFFSFRKSEQRAVCRGQSQRRDRDSHEQDVLGDLQGGGRPHPERNRKRQPEFCQTAATGFGKEDCVE